MKHQEVLHRRETILEECISIVAYCEKSDESGYDTDEICEVMCKNIPQGKLAYGAGLVHRANWHMTNVMQ